MLDALENKIEKSLNNAPFAAKIFFGYELKEMKESLNLSTELRNRYVPTEEWYIEYGKNITKTFNAAYNAIDRSYAIYDSITNLPIMGSFTGNFMEKYLGNFISNTISQDTESNVSQVKPKFKVPKKATTLKVIERTHELSLEAVCAHYETSTGNSADSLRETLSGQLEPYEKDPMPLRACIIYALESIGDFFKEAFYENPEETHKAVAS